MGLFADEANSLFRLRGVFKHVAKTKSLTAPLDRIRMLMQNEDELIDDGRLERKYLGIHDCYNRIIEEEGFLSLWRGNFTNIILHCLIQVILPWLNAVYIALKITYGNDGWLFGALVFLAITAAAGFIIYTFEYAHTRLTMNIKHRGTNTRQFGGLLDVYKTTYAVNGLVGLGRGYLFSLIGFFVHYWILQLRNLAKPFLLAGVMEKNAMASWLIDLAAMLLASLATYPFETIRHRMMMSSSQGFKYNSVWDAGRQIITREGFRALYKGLGASLLYVIAGPAWDIYLKAGFWKAIGL